jgi:hypothetical protein
MSAEKLVTMFCNDTVYSFERESEHSAFTFGGPFETGLILKGFPTGPRPLQLVARLSLDRIPELWKRYRFFELPLFYGFTYSGCELKYRITLTAIEIVELWPEESSDDFPYANYPPLLPYVPLKLSEARPCLYSEFAEEFPNIAEEQPAELIVAVSPPATIGVSLWGPSGDLEGVVVLFECSLTEKTIRAYNKCT